MNKQNNFAFFGSSDFSLFTLETLQERRFIPSLIITTPDKPQGRGMTITPTVVKEWAQKNNIECLNPDRLDESFVTQLKSVCQNKNINLFIVASYGKIIPQSILAIPEKQTLNIHPSLLPKYRGASPLQSTILDDDKNTGITIMRMDEKMDHGPIVAQKDINIAKWPPFTEFQRDMATIGANLLADILPHWFASEIKESPQDHDKATFCRKITKEDGLIDLNDDGYVNFRKIQAYNKWPKAYFLSKNSKVKITKADFKDGKLEILNVIPENSKEIPYSIFLQKNI
jgi:methionyl-tRNA formyltransferase